MTSAARIVFDINDNETVEIPFETCDTHTNNKTRHKAQKVKGSKSKFYYLDIKEYEQKIRADERLRIKKKKEQDIKEFIQVSKGLTAMLFQKSIAACIVYSAVFTIYSSYIIEETFNVVDWILAFLTIPVGLYLFFTKHFFFSRKH